jgi:alpha-1,3-rhamnosyl/mannosyltransferase
VLRVGLDASAAAVNKPTGVGVAIKSLARALPAVPEIELEILYRLSRVKRRSTFLPGSRLFHPRFSVLLARRLDVIHGPDARLPKLKGPALVATIHDLSVRKDARFAEEGFRATRARHWEDTARRADRIVVYTEAVKRDVASALSFPAERIDVVPLAPSDELAPPPPETKEDLVLVLGEISARKNTLGALRAFEKARETSPVARRSTLFIVGPDGHGAAELHDQARGKDHVKTTGWLPSAELREKLSRARALLFPSRSEGFGLPLLEALRAGTPVVASRDPALVEVAGGAALHAQADDIDGLSAHLVSLLEGDARELVARGQARAAEFTWERSARALARVYRAARGLPCLA